MIAKRITLFSIINYTFLSILAFISLIPIIHLIAVSMSETLGALQGKVGLWPVGFTLEPYRYVIEDKAFWNALLVTLKRLLIGVIINITLVVLTAYPLSKENNRFHGRTIYAWLFVFTMLFGGGLVPTYIVITKLLRLQNTIWALTLPGAMSVWYTVLMLNFFRGVPKEIEEAAIIDGANPLQILVRVYLPISIPSLATIILFSSIGHWNSWFDGFIYMNLPGKYPLQTYLAMVLLQSKVNTQADLTPEQLVRLAKVTKKTIEAAQIFLSAVPIMMAYPFLQRYFIKGIVIGSVKG